MDRSPISWDDIGAGHARVVLEVASNSVQVSPRRKVAVRQWLQEHSRGFDTAGTQDDAPGVHIHGFPPERLGYDSRNSRAACRECSHGCMQNALQPFQLADFRTMQPRKIGFGTPAGKK